MRVLLAETNPSRKSLMREILCCDQRIESVDEVSDGGAAVAKASGADVVVIDLGIAGLGSLGAIAGIHDLPSPPQVLAVDSSGELWRERAAMKEGADDVIVWPRESAELPERVTRLVHGS